MNSTELVQVVWERGWVLPALESGPAPPAAQTGLAGGEGIRHLRPPGGWRYLCRYIIYIIYVSAEAGLACLRQLRPQLGGGWQHVWPAQDRAQGHQLPAQEEDAAGDKH